MFQLDVCLVAHALDRRFNDSTALLKTGVNQTVPQGGTLTIKWVGVG